MPQGTGFLRKMLNGQIWLSRLFDRLLPEHYSVDGNEDFIKTFAPKYLQEDLKVYDVGGGKRPYVSNQIKADLQLTVCGLDIDQEELKKAPEGAYDEVVCADITSYEGRGDGDLVICQALLEHVRDVDAALASLVSIVKPGGRVVLFVPSRNALFARLNLLLPQELKKKILFTIFSCSRPYGGFPSFYDRCTPRDFEALAARHGLVVEETRCYFMSAYFSFFFPAYVAWRLWLLLFRVVAGDQAAETFSMALRKGTPAPLLPEPCQGRSLAINLSESES